MLSKSAQNYLPNRSKPLTGIMNQETTVPMQAMVHKPMLKENESWVPIPACWKKYAPPPKNQSPHSGIMHIVTQAISVLRRFVFFRQSYRGQDPSDHKMEARDSRGMTFLEHPPSRARSCAPGMSVLARSFHSPSLQRLGRGPDSQWWSQGA